MILTTIEETKRFLSHIEDKGICWIWNGAIRDNYGRSWHRGKTYTSHRLSYKLYVGDIIKGNDIHHICKNKLCVNPSHLKSVSKKEHGKLDLKTHCKYGHEFTPDNTYKRKGKRWCKICAGNRYK